ncbi:MAG TPA: Stk1 family PASTA domain-containing Ser/Thr kinase [Acidimicrobiales bacterium]|nr:Stk1 family PASTA domain-containing Ser/Thr kinase [Acidimicrobiales bacterium]
MTQTPSSIYNGRYELRSQIARGGTAHVYLAHDILLDRPVALKVLYPELSTNNSFVERFRREAQAAANLSHPNIVQIFDWGESEDTYFIVMEYIDGEPLSSIIRTQSPIAADQAAAVAADIAKALGYAHRHGVIHRDVKPGNVLITQDGQVKVTDFGIARAIGADEQVTQTGLVMGTATYFAPEQAQGLEVDGRSDIYSLGVVLYEMVTGRAPFTGETPVAIAYQHVREQPVPPRSMNPAIPSALEAIILQAMAKLPADRFRSADEMRADLDRFVRGQTVLAHPPVETFTGPATAVIDAEAINAHLNSEKEFEDDDEIVEQRATNTRKWLIGGGALAVAIILLIILGGQALGYFGGGAYFAVPDVKGMKPATALRVLKNAELIARTRTVVGNISNQHTVIGQSPTYPNTVRKGAKVLLTIAGPAPTASIPRVVGRSRITAERALSLAGFRSRSLPVGLPGVKQNVVVKESPAGGITKPKGTLVTISYVQNHTVIVPMIIGDNAAKAGSALTKANLRVGSTGSQFSQTIPNGNVVSTTPAAGTVVRAGKTVNLIISSGPGVSVPSLIGQSQSQAVTTITSLGLVAKKGAPIGTTIAGYIGNVAAQRVLGSNARVGDQVAPRSTILYRIGVSTTPSTTGTTGVTGNSGTTTTTTSPFPG